MGTTGKEAITFAPGRLDPAFCKFALLVEAGDITTRVIDSPLGLGKLLEILGHAWEIGDHLELGAIERLREMLGMYFFRLHIRGYRMLVAHQVEYTREPIRRFVDENGGPPRKAQTPWIVVDVSLELETGVLVLTARRHLGGLVYLVRCIRVDAEQAANPPCREVTRWTMASGQRLRRIFVPLFRSSFHNPCF